jgi:glycerol-3-phosphate acyltransferase PlsY
MWWMYCLLACAGYLVGSIPVGLLVGRRVRGVDIREFGSGKTGFTNSLRTLGLGPSLVVVAGDMLKGAVPVLAASLLWTHAGLRHPGSPADLQVVAATAAVVGHILPVFAGFKGGRGVATSWGATVAMMPPVALALLGVAAVLALVYRYMSVASIVGAPTGALIVWALILTGREPVAYGIWGLVASALILLLHRDNLRRLRNGTEPKIGHGGRRRASAGNAHP